MSIMEGLGLSSRYCGTWPGSWLIADRISLARYSTPDTRRWLSIKRNLLDEQVEPDHARLLTEDLFNVILNENINYALEPYTGLDSIQELRHLDAIIEQKQATCIDLSLAFAGLCIAHNLLPIVVLLQGHALVMVSLKRTASGWRNRPEIDQRSQKCISKSDGLSSDAKVLLELIESGEYIAIECTGTAFSKSLAEWPYPQYPECEGREKTYRMSFEAAVKAGYAQIQIAAESLSPVAIDKCPPRKLLCCIDVGCAFYRHRIQPYSIPGMPWSRQLARRRRYLTLGIIATLLLLGIFLYSYSHYKTSRDKAESLSSNLVSDATHLGKIKDLVDTVDNSVKPYLIQSLENQLGESGKSASFSEARTRGYARAKSAIALAHLGKWNKLTDILNNEELPDTPDSRAYVTFMLPMASLDPNNVIAVLSTTESTRVRQDLLQVLGSYEVDTRKLIDLVKLAGQLYEHDDDPGVHASAMWILKNRCGEQGLKEKQVIDERLLAEGSGRLNGKDKNQRHWFVGKTTKLTFVYIPSGQTYLMGNLSTETQSPLDLGNGQQPVNVLIPRAFAVAMTELCIGDIAHLNKATQSPPQSEYPLSDLSWSEAARLCNRYTVACNGRLNQCYGDEYGTPARPRRRENHLNNTGFRLPTEAEWELFSRAGSRKAYCYGNDPSLITRYASWRNKTPKERASYLPNNFGLFDVHGGVEEWCDDSADDNPKVPYASITDYGTTDESSDWRVLRGGENTRSKFVSLLTVYNRNKQTVDSKFYGVRLVRTVTTFPPTGD